METGNLVVSWVLQLKEIVAICGLLWLIWFTYAKHIPFILLRDQQRAEKDADRAATAHQRDQERWTAALDKTTAVLERLDATMHSMVHEVKEVIRVPRGRA